MVTTPNGLFFVALRERESYYREKCKQFQCTTGIEAVYPYVPYTLTYQAYKIIALVKNDVEKLNPQLNQRRLIQQNATLPCYRRREFSQHHSTVYIICLAVTTRYTIFDFRRS